MEAEIIVLITVLSTTCVPFMLIVIWSIFSERKENRKIEYQKWRMKFIKRNPQVQPGQAENPIKPPGMGELLANLDSAKIKNILNSLGNREYDDEEEPDSGGVNGLIDFATKNPEIVKGLLSGITTKKDEGKPPEGLI